MPDVIILEDDLVFQWSLKQILPGDLKMLMVETSEKLRQILPENTNVKLLMLDDRVPPQEGQSPKPCFIDNARFAMRILPNAEIFYTGNMPTDKEEEFCRDNRIRMIEKFDIIDMLEAMKR